MAPLLKNTIRAYRSDFIQYQTWCSHNNMDSIPATADAMAQYVDYLATIKKSATIRRRINSLGTVLKLSKHYDPTNQPEVILAIKRMHRKIGRAQQQATPLTKPLLNQLLSNCDNSFRGLRNQVLYDSATKPCDADRSSAPLSLRTSAKRRTENRLSGSISQKRINSGLGKILPISQELFDLLEKWRSMISDEGYILRSISRHGHIGATYTQQV